MLSRNSETRFALNPTNVNISRSTFDRSCSIKTSFNVGSIIPFYVDEVLPGDTFNVRTSLVARLQTLITPMMDNLYLDTYYFYVPNRLVWEHWRQFMGENTQSAWIPQTQYSVPQLTSPSGGWSVGTIADYLGVPTGISNLSVNALPFRAYALICNEWFRDENLSDPLNIPISDSTVAGSNGSTYITDVAKGGIPYTASKYHDYFTSCLPAPQKGPDVTIPVGSTGPYPVFSTNDFYGYSENHIDGGPMVGYPVTLNLLGKRYVKESYQGGQSGTTTFYENRTIQDTGIYPRNLEVMQPSTGATERGYNFSGNSYDGFAPSNLWAYDLAGAASAATINQLRQAFQVQKMYERDARGGTRYIELLKSHFGVTSPDARLQRPEYLGGSRIPVHINQIIQQSSTDATSPQGNVTGQSLTTDVHDNFVRSFTEHGFIIGLCVARYDHTYQQGLERFWSRTQRLDYYFPVFAHLGEMGVRNKEIYAQGSSVKDSDGNVIDDQIFGYQEAWADYRYKPNRVSGEMRSAYTTSLDFWHLGDDYSQLPSLSDTWIREDKTNVDRVLAVQSSVSNQMFCDFYVQNRTTRPMPLYSVPGLIDHF